MHETFESISDDLATVTGGYDWTETFRVSALFAAGNVAFNTFAAWRLRRGWTPVKAAVLGAVEGVGADMAAQGMRSK